MDTKGQLPSLKGPTAEEIDELINNVFNLGSVTVNIRWESGKEKPVINTVIIGNPTIGMNYTVQSILMKNAVLALMEVEAENESICSDS